MSVRDDMDFLMFNQTWAYNAAQDIWKVSLSFSSIPLHIQEICGNVSGNVQLK